MLVKIILALAVAAVMLTVPVTSDAGGLFLTEFGTEDVALAGAGWAARAQDASTLFKNPAGMSRLQGNQFQGGLQAMIGCRTNLNFIGPLTRSLMSSTMRIQMSSISMDSDTKEHICTIFLLVQ